MRRERRRPISGGHFDYKQHHIRDIANDIESAIYRSKKKKRITMYFLIRLSRSSTSLFADCMKQVYAQRIDWLLSGDDGEDTFHERLKADLKELEKK